MSPSRDINPPPCSSSREFGRALAWPPLSGSPSRYPAPWAASAHTIIGGAKLPDQARTESRIDPERPTGELGKELQPQGILLRKTRECTQHMSYGQWGLINAYSSIHQFWTSHSDPHTMPATWAEPAFPLPSHAFQSRDRNSHEFLITKIIANNRYNKWGVVRNYIWEVWWFWDTEKDPAQSCLLYQLVLILLAKGFIGL